MLDVAFILSSIHCHFYLQEAACGFKCVCVGPSLRRVIVRLEAHAGDHVQVLSPKCFCYITFFSLAFKCWWANSGGADTDRRTPVQQLNYHTIITIPEVN